ncbi:MULTISPECIES: tRNA (adenosine(37)-N6)-threonylcarbamoyltransferase complex ATPase subunit type 1 TsaE [Marinobacter]|uniref:tRNA threonylcarbamoyladenosine biosynthesis protein TsaE n=1 Tax=Marinobacter profundi TaxID=2666256 RepID=A0A2G1UIL3_9GAMM|nr:MULTISPECIES: tRNA (adenosine(37)-N6)-threonylcarbamoyltransferase complex ATPase subunit type 1 TsaE [Marinobacter]MBD3655239.1 tRNA (adenosine(37)-N6)-threonylcarbamoyltransferase complex ATPase subunit type 1 TsaE [Marinobacter sp.]PHQ14341.1 tRNA (adenosine(37)-N6)-threonylcarbamoyltransferase complex ATPase subunit type 1 TsaE [Marinobacter profundi]
MAEQAMELELADEAATVALGGRLARAVIASGQGLTLFLEGNLGMGKTTLSRGFMRGLGHQGAVKSPTYTLVEPYEHLQPPTFHFDLYRLGDPEELEYMGIRDYFSGAAVCLIEWAERGAGILPPADLVVRLQRQGRGRKAMLLAGSAAGQRVLDLLASAAAPDSAG